MNAPDLFFDIIPVPGAHWGGKVSIRCKESGLEAELIFYKSQSFFGFGGNSRAIKGKVFDSKTLKTMYEIEGQWDRTVLMKDVQSGDTVELYDAGEAISKLSTPLVKNPEASNLKEMKPTESAMVWGEVSKAILLGNWDKAREEKRKVEEGKDVKKGKELQRRLGSKALQDFSQQGGFLGLLAIESLGSSSANYHPM
ncbi:hypothetical protein HPP92_010402 [Vanilla planifolia]|uniref:Uncharacterized protein n=1 Tax=Vanilla planifolia TaxID=51239 RepID=A0A835UXH8_VANPL|nr:hypothetical protein HPP92_010402 [Vanilla planifolia]